MLLAVASDVSGEMFTALVDLEQLLHAEREVALHLRRFVNQQTQHLSQLMLYVYVTFCPSSISPTDRIPVCLTIRECL